MVGVVKMLDTLSAHIGMILQEPVTVFFLAGVFVLLVSGFYIRRKRLTIYEIVNISLVIALTVLLNEIRLYHFPQGGSVTLGGMVPLLLLTHCYGMRIGMLGGFLYGLILIVQDPFILHPVQVLFDYPLPYMAVGLAALLPRHIIASAVVVFAGKFLCHFISGIVFFASYAPEGMSPVLYSLMVNLSLQVPECVICCLILKFLPVTRLLSAMKEIGGR